MSQEYFEPLELEAALDVDLSRFMVTRILRRSQCLRVEPRRDLVERARRPLAKRLMRSFLIEFLAEEIEAPLLRFKRGFGGSSRFRLQSAVHSFMTPVLVRPAFGDPLMEDPEFDPPDRELA